MRLGPFAALVIGGAAAAWGAEVASYRVIGDAIPAPLTAQAGDADRGKQVVVGPDSNCLLCHAVPGSGVRFMGNVGPPLAGVGARLSAGQLRLRIVDPLRVNPGAVMPSYHRVEGLNQVARQHAGKPVLTAQQVEDVVAYLAGLK